MTLGTKLFIVVSILIPILLIGSLVVENQQPVAKNKEVKMSAKEKIRKSKTESEKAGEE